VTAAPLLVATVGTVGVLHTLVPDHWAPIVVLARQQGWSMARTVRTAALAGVGHVGSTLALGLVVWLAGISASVRYGHVVDVVAAAALVVFGAWVAYGGWKELRHDAHHSHHGHAHQDHAHLHVHDDGTRHVHWHQHHDADEHGVQGGAAVLHVHAHRATGRTALLLILGSSPMVEGIPAFLAASAYGATVIAIMAAVFAATTIATYVATCAFGVAGLARISLGPLERYGEVLSGAFVAAVGVYSLLTS
jgi:ABC-type nickel/cobalt efflux system permease component RcnA